MEGRGKLRKQSLIQKSIVSYIFRPTITPSFDIKPQKEKEHFLTDCLLQNTGDGHTLTQQLLVQLLNLQSANTSYRLCSSHNFTSTGTAKDCEHSFNKAFIKKRTTSILYVNIFELVLNARESIVVCQSLWQWHHKFIKSLFLCQTCRNYQFGSTDNIQRHNSNIWQTRVSK